jgi:hypothetical protein
MKVRWGGSPTQWLVIVGVILIAFVFSSNHTSALNGAIFVVGLLLLLAALIRWLLVRAR